MTGPELKKLRQSLGLSIPKAARQVDVSDRTWARWEASSDEPPRGAVRLFRIQNGLESPGVNNDRRY